MLSQSWKSNNKMGTILYFTILFHFLDPPIIFSSIQQFMQIIFYEYDYGLIHQNFDLLSIFDVIWFDFMLRVGSSLWHYFTLYNTDHLMIKYMRYVCFDQYDIHIKFIDIDCIRNKSHRVRISKKGKSNNISAFELFPKIKSETNSLEFYYSPRG